jgi:hypothetical protein
MKNKKRIIITLSFLVLFLLFLGFILSKDNEVHAFDNIPKDLKKVTLYKDPNCGCCSGHAKMYKDAGFDVEIITNEDLNKIKSKYGISPDIASCHTAIMGNYVIEGHVPLEGIEMLIKERPNIKGITLPGMPIGTPGMPGMKTETYKIRNIESKEIILEI